MTIQFMDMARAAAAGSTDRSRQAGCVIVSQAGEVVVEGCNAFPAGIADTEERHQRPEKYFWVEHAERNAIYQAARDGISLKGCTLYVPWFPCMDCARALGAVGIVELVAVRGDVNDPKWGEDFKRVETLLSEAGVALRFLDDATEVTT